MKRIRTVELDMDDPATAALVESDGYWREMIRREMSTVRAELGIPQDETLAFSWASTGEWRSKRCFDVERANTVDLIHLSEDWIKARGLTALLNMDERMMRFIGAKTRTVNNGSE